MSLRSVMIFLLVNIHTRKDKWTHCDIFLFQRVAWCGLLFLRTMINMAQNVDEDNCLSLFKFGYIKG